MLTKGGPEHVRVDADPAGVNEGVVEASLGIGDPAESRSTRAGSVTTVTSSVTSKRISGCAWLYRLVTYTRWTGTPNGTGRPSGVDRLEDAQIIGQVAGVPAEPSEDPLGHPVAVADGTSQARWMAARASGSNGSAMPKPVGAK